MSCVDLAGRFSSVQELGSISWISKWGMIVHLKSICTGWRELKSGDEVRNKDCDWGQFLWAQELGRKVGECDVH